MSDAPDTQPGDEPAALKPDEPTAVHSTAGSAGADSPATPAPDAPAPDVPGDAAAVPEPPASPAPAPAPLAPPAPPVEPAPAWSPPAGTDGDAAAASPVAERPEIAVGAAFAGGLVLALILKRLAR